ncbi:hypothetical protein HGRIS_014094 [Hohenbuehelia grisea]|uniref:Uncharacterized protein n=1 Tax=Hohenbuehelia grisea TaxID=104357 RepID=A0ABR3JUI4_9AGAR
MAFTTALSLQYYHHTSTTGVTSLNSHHVPELHFDTAYSAVAAPLLRFSHDILRSLLLSRQPIATPSSHCTPSTSRLVFPVTLHLSRTSQSRPLEPGGVAPRLSPSVKTCSNHPVSASA